MDVPLPRPAPSTRLPAILFGCTLLTVFGTFLVLYSGETTAGGGFHVTARSVLQAVQFTIAALGILGAHELGHWVLARRHRVETSLPYFIPLPLLGFGTLGAVIRMRGRIPDRNALVDIGAAGPLAGFVVALPFLAWGYAHSSFVPAPAFATGAGGSMSLWHVLTTGRFPDAGGPYSYADNLLLLGMQRLFLGASPPGMDVLAHPFVLAGWLGSLVTMLNLIPVGQLDMGHLTFALFGDRARAVGRLALAGLAFLVVAYSMTWIVWLLVVGFVIGTRHPAVVAPDVPLTRGRVWVCAATGVVLVLCFLPAPLLFG